MIIVWGKKIHREVCGHSLIFCPLCRDLTCSEVISIRRVDHIYFMSMGKGQHVADEQRCPVCETTLGAFEPDRLHDQPWLTGDLHKDLDLIDDPHRSRLLARVNLEHRAIAQDTSPDERQWLLAEPVIAAAYEHQLRMQRGSYKSLSAVVQCLALFSLAGAAICWFGWWDKLDPHHSDWLLWALGFTAAAIFLVCLVFFREMRHGRAAACPLLSRLAASLAPLRPTKPELTTVLQALKHNNNELAAALAPAQLVPN